MENNTFSKEKIEKINELIKILNKMRKELLNRNDNQIISNGETKRNARIRMIRKRRRR